jgi:hypothetical protein
VLGGPQPGGSIAVIPDIFGIVEVAAAVITNFPKFSIVGFVYEGTALAVPLHPRRAHEYIVMLDHAVAAELTAWPRRRLVCNHSHSFSLGKWCWVGLIHSMCEVY